MGHVGANVRGAVWIYRCLLQGRTMRAGTMEMGTSVLKAIVDKVSTDRCRTRRDQGLIFGKKLGMETPKTIAKPLIISS